MANDDAIAELKRRVERLEHELGIQQDIHAIRRLKASPGDLLLFLTEPFGLGEK
jgi:hypothetical protein